jgi:hypothetical protein
MESIRNPRSIPSFQGTSKLDGKSKRGTVAAGANTMGVSAITDSDVTSNKVLAVQRELFEILRYITPATLNDTDKRNEMLNKLQDIGGKLSPEELDSVLLPEDKEFLAGIKKDLAKVDFQPSMDVQTSIFNKYLACLASRMVTVVHTDTASSGNYMEYLAKISLTGLSIIYLLIYADFIRKTAEVIQGQIIALRDAQKKIQDLIAFLTSLQSMCNKDSANAQADDPKASPKDSNWDNINNNADITKADYNLGNYMFDDTTWTKCQMQNTPMVKFLIEIGAVNLLYSSTCGSRYFQLIPNPDLIKKDGNGYVLRYDKLKGLKFSGNDLKFDGNDNPIRDQNGTRNAQEVFDWLANGDGKSINTDTRLDFLKESYRYPSADYSAYIGKPTPNQEADFTEIDGKPYDPAKDPRITPDNKEKILMFKEGSIPETYRKVFEQFKRKDKDGNIYYALSKQAVIDRVDDAIKDATSSLLGDGVADVGKDNIFGNKEKVNSLRSNCDGVATQIKDKITSLANKIPDMANVMRDLDSLFNVTLQSAKPQ